MPVLGRPAAELPPCPWPVPLTRHRARPATTTCGVRDLPNRVPDPIAESGPGPGTEPAWALTRGPAGCSDSGRRRSAGRTPASPRQAAGTCPARMRRRACRCSHDRRKSGWSPQPRGSRTDGRRLPGRPPGSNRLEHLEATARCRRLPPLCARPVPQDARGVHQQRLRLVVAAEHRERRAQQTAGGGDLPVRIGRISDIMPVLGRPAAELPPSPWPVLCH